MMNRGDIYWVDLNKTIGSEINKLRPCVLVGATPINQARRTVLIIPLSTKATSKPPITVNVSCLNKSVIAVCDQIRAIDKTRLKKQAGSLLPFDLARIEQSLQQILCLQ